MPSTNRPILLLRPLGLAAALVAAACESPPTEPAEGAANPPVAPMPSAGTVGGLTLYTDRAEWEAAVTTAGSTALLLDFAGLTTGRITQLDTDYGIFRIVVDDVSATTSSNPGIDIFPDASCSTGTGDCDVFTFNLLDPTSTLDGPKTNDLIFPGPIAAFGGDFIQLGMTAGGTPSVTGPVTLHFGSDAVVVNGYLDANGNGFFGFVANAPATTVGFTFAKSASLQNDIFQVYNPAVATASDNEPTPEEQIASLQGIVAGLGLPAGTASSLQSKLTAALAALAANDPATACARLRDFVKYATVQSGKKIPAGTAAALIADANAIRADLGC